MRHLDALKAREAQLTQEVEEAATRFVEAALLRRQAAVRAEIAVREEQS